MTARRALMLVTLIGVTAAGAWYGFGRQPQAEQWLGYAEADYVKVGPTQQGRLVSLSAVRGDEVLAGAPLFAQDEAEDLASRDQAAAEVAQAREKLADLEGAGRDAEIEQARANFMDMQAAYDRVARDLTRNETLVLTGSASRQSVDQLRADTRSARARVDAAQAKLTLMTEATGRAHAITAQQAAVAAAQASMAAAQWRLDQRRVTAPAAGRIADTYARPGETIAAGAPVISLLPPENILVRFFVPETALARMHPGDPVGITCDSCPPDLKARISFVATAPEYTPPVIYSEGARGSLVYLIEARPDPSRHPLLKPGQPVAVIPPDGARGG